MMRAGRGPRRREAGLSLVELLIAMFVLAIAMVALLSLIVSSSTVQQETREKTLAYNAARKTLEAMRGTTFNEIYRRYNTYTGDNSQVTGTCPGSTFTVEGLNQSGSTPVGQILFAEVNLTGGGLTEAGSTANGIPAKDLNQNGNTSDSGFVDDYKVLPVRIVVTWAGVANKTTAITVDSFITDK